MSVGIRNFFRSTVATTVAASTVLVDVTGLSVPVAAGQTVCLDIYIPFSVGATGGFKFQLVTPAAVTAFNAALFAFDGVTVAPGSQVGVVQTASAAFANAWAVAGNHMLLVKATITNGVNAGNVKMQIACNSAANSISALVGATMDVVLL